jgi:hypothetical protein
MIGLRGGVIAASGSAFTPRNVPGLVYWGDADNVTLDIGVDAMPDMSDEGNDFTQVIDAAQPSLVSSWRNGRDAMSFGGTGRLELASFVGTDPITQPITIYAVGEFSAAAALEYLFDNISGSTDRIISYKNVEDKPALFAGSTHTNSATVTASTPFIWCFNIDGASSSFRIVQDGLSDIDTGTVNVGTNGLTGLTLGSSNAGSAGWQGKVAAFVIFDAAVSAANDAKMFDYFSTRYDIVGL